MPIIIAEMQRIKASHHHAVEEEELKCALCSFERHEYLDHRYGVKSAFTPYAVTLPVFRRRPAAAVPLQQARPPTSESSVPDWIRQARTSRAEANDAAAVPLAEGLGRLMLPGPSSSISGEARKRVGAPLDSSTQQEASSSTFNPGSSGAHKFIFRPLATPIRCGVSSSSGSLRKEIRPSESLTAFVAPDNDGGVSGGVPARGRDAPEIPNSEYFDFDFTSDNDDDDEGFVTAVASSTTDNAGLEVVVKMEQGSSAGEESEVELGDKNEESLPPGSGNNSLLLTPNFRPNPKVTAEEVNSLIRDPKKRRQTQARVTGSEDSEVPPQDRSAVNLFSPLYGPRTYEGQEFIAPGPAPMPRARVALDFDKLASRYADENKEPPCYTQMKESSWR